MTTYICCCWYCVVVVLVLCIESRAIWRTNRPQPDSPMSFADRSTIITVLTMACVSSNRICARVVKETLCQFLLVNNENTIYQQTRRKLTGGNIFTTNRKINNQSNGFSFLSARTILGKKQVSYNDTLWNLV